MGPGRGISKVDERGGKTSDGRIGPEDDWFEVSVYRGKRSRNHVNYAEYEAEKPL